MIKKWSDYTNVPIPNDGDKLLYENAGVTNSLYQTYGQLKTDLSNKIAGGITHSLTVGISNSLSIGGDSKIPMNIIHNNAYTGSPILTLSNGGIYCPAGYFVECQGFAKSYSGGGYITFKIYRGGVSLTSLYGADTTSSDTDANTGSGVECVASYNNTSGAYFYLYRTGGTSTSIYTGNSNIGSTYLKLTAHKI